MLWILAIVVVCCAAGVILYAGPPGEAGDWKRLQRSLTEDHEVGVDHRLVHRPHAAALLTG